MAADVCDGTLQNGTPCGEPLGPPPRRSSKCAGCRQAHRKAKQADYQWAIRVHERERKIDRQRAAGNLHFTLPALPERQLTPSWTHDGRPAPEPELDALEALEEELYGLQESVAAACEALGEVLRKRS